MAATIKTTIEDNSKEWSDSFIKRLRAADGATEGFEGSLNELAKDLLVAGDAASMMAQKQYQLHGQTMGTTRQVAFQNSELKELVGGEYAAAKAASTLADRSRELQQAMDPDKVAKYRKEMNSLAQASGNVAKSGGGVPAINWTSMASKMALVKEGFDILRSVAGGAMSVIDDGADRGIASFVRLKGSLDLFQEEMLKLRTNGVIRDFAEGSALAIETGLIPAIKSSVEWVDKQATAVRRAYFSWAEFIGLEKKGMNFAFDAMNQVRGWEQQYKDSLARMAEERKKYAQAQADIQFLNPERGLALQRNHEEMLAGLKTEQDVIAAKGKLIDEQAERTRELQAKGIDPRSDQETVGRMQKIADIVKRGYALKDQAVAESQKKELEESKKWWDDMQEAARNGITKLVEAQADAGKAHAGRAAKRNLEDAKDTSHLTPMLQQARQQIMGNPMQVHRALVKQAEAKAVSGQEDATPAFQDRLRQQARADLRRRERTGQVSEGEVSGAIGGMMEQQLKTLEKSGKTEGRTVGLISQVIRELQNKARESEETDERINHLEDIVRNLTGGRKPGNGKRSGKMG